MQFPDKPGIKKSKSEELIEIKKKKAEIWNWKIPKKNDVPGENEPKKVIENRREPDPDPRTKHVAHVNKDAWNSLELEKFTFDQFNGFDDHNDDDNSIIPPKKVKVQSDVRARGIIPPKKIKVGGSEVRVRASDTKTIDKACSLSSQPSRKTWYPFVSVNPAITKCSPEVKQADFGYGVGYETNFAPGKQYWEYNWNVLLRAIEDFQVYIATVDHPELMKFRIQLESIDRRSKSFTRCENNYIHLLEEYKECLLNFNRAKQEL